jgi:hypothetical protein
MSDKQNPGLDKDNSSPTADEQSRDQNESPVKSYYYDDATGYEIYKEESDDDEEESS